VGVWADISRRRITGPILFGGKIPSKMFFSKKLTIFSGTLMAVRYREIIHKFLKQLYDDEIGNGYFQQRQSPCTHYIRDLEYDFLIDE
jgi:hypothetical protein